MLGDGPADFSFPIPEEATDRIDALIDYYGAAAKSSPFWRPARSGKPSTGGSESFAEVARHFLHNGFAVMLIGAARERAACEEVARLAPGAVNLAGETTLTELAALIRRSTISVTNDSGPMHLAVAVDRPVVSIFGPTDPIWIGPYGRAGAVLQAKLPCSPCYLRQLSRCPNGHACMRDVSAQDVIERAERVLNKPAGGSGGPCRSRQAPPGR